MASQNKVEPAQCVCCSLLSLSNLSHPSSLSLSAAGTLCGGFFLLRSRIRRNRRKPYSSSAEIIGKRAARARKKCSGGAMMCEKERRVRNWGLASSTMEFFWDARDLTPCDSVWQIKSKAAAGQLHELYRLCVCAGRIMPAATISGSRVGDFFIKFANADVWYRKLSSCSW